MKTTTICHHSPTPSMALGRERAFPAEHLAPSLPRQKDQTCFKTCRWRSTDTWKVTHRRDRSWEPLGALLAVGMSCLLYKLWLVGSFQVLCGIREENLDLRSKFSALPLPPCPRLAGPSIPLSATSSALDSSNLLFAGVRTTTAVSALLLNSQDELKAF